MRAFPPSLPGRSPVPRWMVLSGGAGLLYEIVLQKIFSYVIGGSLISATVTIAAYMAGLSIGAFASGALIRHRPRSRPVLRLYGGVEVATAFVGLLLLGLYCYLPAEATLWLAQGSLWTRALVAFVAVLPLSTLLGAPFPIAAAVVAAEAPRGETPNVSSVYAANLLGAIGGTVLGAYFLLPPLGLWGATIAAAVCNLYVGGAAWRRAGAAARPPHTSAGERPGSADGSITVEHAALAFASGAILFAAEVIWTHLLAAVVGSSVYAFANMLAAVLVALYIAARREARGSDTAVARLFALGAAWLAVSIPAIALSGFAFGVVGIFSSSFFLREVTRFAVAAALIVPSAAILSQVFPRLLHELAKARRVHHIGSIAAINTIGSVVGLVAARFLLVPYVGSALSLRLLVVLLMAIALAMTTKAKARAKAGDGWRLTLRGARNWVFVVAAMAGFFIPSWRPSWLLSGRNIYFSLTSEAQFHKVLYRGEDAESGFVTVSELASGVKELRTNGKFEGNDSDEMSAQLSFGYLPTLAAARTDAAFLIGLGTGVTLKGLADFPFTRLDVAERSLPMVHAARSYFQAVNGGVLSDGRVHVIHDDGRNALMRSRAKYDIVSIEITSIWFAGAADLYSRNFYRVVNDHLAQGGVLQQWLQLHHMRLQDLWILLNTVRTEFPHVCVWYSGGQAQILASQQPVTLDWGRLRAVRPTRPGLAMRDDALFKMAGSVLLDEAGVDEFLAPVQGVVGKRIAKLLVSSDLWPYLEYATPRGNVYEYADRLNVMYLRELLARPTPSPVRGGIAGDPTFEAARAYFSQDCSGAERLSAVPGVPPRLAALFRTCAPWILVPARERH